MIDLLVQRISAGLFTKKTNFWYKKYITFTSFHWKRQIKKISVWYIIYRYWWGRSREEKNQSINDISWVNNKYIIQCYNKTISNIPEETRYISSMTETGFINGKYELRYYVNLSLHVLFPIYLKTVNHEYSFWDNYRKYGQQKIWLYICYVTKNMILQVIQVFFVKC